MKRFFVTLLLLLCVTVSFAHPGGTDGQGGHWNHSTGTYHYHHGYSAHQHPGGVCPYDFDDKTGQSSGGSSSSKSSTSYKSTKNNTQLPFITKEKEQSFADKVSYWLPKIIASIVFGGWFILLFLWEMFNSIKDDIKKLFKKT